MIEGVSSQYFSASFASATLIRVSVSANPASPAVSSSSSTASDKVRLSGAALSAASGTVDRGPTVVAGPSAAPDVAGPPDQTVAPATSPSVSRSEQQANALLDALDSDKDGVLSEDEFVRGARALLRRAGRHGHGHHHESHGPGDVGRGSGHGPNGHIRRRLERAFGQIDADGNGSVDKAELIAALESGSTKPADPTVATPASASSAPAQSSSAGAATAVPTLPGTPSAPPASVPASGSSTTGAASTSVAQATAGGSVLSVSVMTVTFVSVAVQRYQAASQLAA